MASLRQTREALLLSHAIEVIDEEEFLLLYDVNKSKNPSYPYWNYDAFDLDSMTDDECKSEFRFLKNDVYLLEETLDIPDAIKCYNGVVVDGVEALCIMLKRFSYPCRYVDMMPRFGRAVPQLSMISNRIADIIFDDYGHLLRNLAQPWLSQAELKQFAESIHAKGAPLETCWGFIDGTVRPPCKPGQNQRALYNGHKRVHSIKFQSVVAPNGLIANLYGPVEGKRHDSGLLADSGLLNDLSRYSFAPDGTPLCIYDDPAYPLRVHLQGPFKGAALTPLEQHFNKSMSQVRVAVEWVFGDITNYFAFLDFKKNLKIGLSSVGKMYIVCSLLRNAHICLYHSSTSEFFGIDPPAIKDYFT